jgi:1-acyl-sn-glycerol-3-phosphate acyltransferase
MKILRYTWAVYFLFCFIVIFIILYPLFYWFLRDEKGYPKAHALRRFWGKSLMAVTGLFGEITFEEPMSLNQTYIFAPNHYSYLDILAVNTLMPHYFNFMAKHDLSKIPLFKIFFRTIDIAVNRSSRVEAGKSYLKAIGRLKNGNSLLIFPEGGITNNEPSLSRFKMGAFKMAIETKTPIVPISLPDNFNRLPAGGLKNGGTPGRMRMYVHKPIQTAHLQERDASALANQVYNILDKKLKELQN